MNRFVLTMALGCSVWLIAGSVGAAEEPQGATAAPAASPLAGGLSREVVEREQAIAEWRGKLSGSTWDLEMTVSSGGPLQVVEADVLTFDRRTMGSETLTKAGYERATYALYPPTAESVEWEAMQQKAEKGIEETAIWRGKVTDKTMQGTLTRQHKKGTKDTVDHFAFTGQMRGSAPVDAVSEPVPAQPEPSSAPGGSPATP